MAPRRWDCSRMVSPYDKRGNLKEKTQIAQRAVENVKDHTILGIGSGSTMELFVELLAKRIASEHLNLQCVASSKKIEQKATQLGFVLKDISDVISIDQAFDGADRVDAYGNLIKGGGGSLFRERQVLLMAREKTIVADSSKFVSTFQNAVIPIEIVSFNANFTMQQIEKVGLKATRRNSFEGDFVTDNGNYVVDAVLLSDKDLKQVYQELKLISGVVEVGLFLNDHYEFIKVI